MRNQQQMPPVIVVGIVSHNRSKDMLPKNLGSAADRFAANVGGADQFIQFIDEEVHGYLQEHYRVAPYKMLFGHLEKNRPTNLTFDTAIIPGNHGSMVQGATIKALSEHFADWSPSAAPEAYTRGGYTDLSNHLLAVSKRYPFATGSIVNNKMYSVVEDLFVNQGLLDTAVSVGEQLIADFPDQILPRFHEALGRGYYLQGDRKKAVDTLAKVYALNPGSDFAVEVLSQPGVDAGINLPPAPPSPESLQKYIGIYHVNGVPVLETLVRNDGLWVNHLQEPLVGPLRWLGGQDFYAIGPEKIHYQFQTENTSGAITGVQRDSALGIVTASKE